MPSEIFNEMKEIEVTWPNGEAGKVRCHRAASATHSDCGLRGVTHSDLGETILFLLGEDTHLPWRDHSL